jgi:hypothetical protein
MIFSFRIVEDLVHAHAAANLQALFDERDEDPELKALLDKSKLAMLKLVRIYA